MYIDAKPLREVQICVLEAHQADRQTPITKHLPVIRYEEGEQVLVREVWYDELSFLVPKWSDSLVVIAKKGVRCWLRNDDRKDSRA